MGSPAHSHTPLLSPPKVPNSSNQCSSMFHEHSPSIRITCIAHRKGRFLGLDPNLQTQNRRAWSWNLPSGAHWSMRTNYHKASRITETRIKAHRLLSG